jgi:hypothetical protein
MAVPKDKKKIKGFKEFDPAKYIDIEPMLDEAVKNDTVVFTFGRMNPMTIGHEKLAERVIKEAAALKAEPMIFLSHSSGAKSKKGKGSENKDPLVYEDKIKYAIKAFGPVVKKSPLKVLILIVKSLQGKYKNLVMVAGSDRVDEYTTLLNKYNGKDYKFDSIKVVSAGQRDPDGVGAAGMSGTKMREYAIADNLKKFTAGLPKALRSIAGEIMDKVSEASAITEEVEELDEVLNRMQRRKRGLAMRKARFKIKRGREKAKKRTASQEVLKGRAKKAAINVFKKKFAKQKRYADLSPGEKEVVDKRIAKINKKRIEQIARKLLPQVKQKERDRRKAHMSGGSSPAKKNEEINEATVELQALDPKNSSLLRSLKRNKVNMTIVERPKPSNGNAFIVKLTGDTKGIKSVLKTQWDGEYYDEINEASYKDQRILKKPHMLLDGEKKPKLDRRFKMFKKKPVNESAEDINEELMDLIEATEQFNEATIPDGKTAMTKRDPLTKSDTKTLKKLRDMMKKEKKPVRKEEAGAGEEGTDVLVNKFKKDTPNA